MREQGDGDRATDEVERVLGRDPRTIRAFVDDHADAFTLESDRATGANGDSTEQPAAQD